jgi:hypothetical protein
VESSRTQSEDCQTHIGLTGSPRVQFPGEPEKIELKGVQALKAAKILGVKEAFCGSFPGQTLDVRLTEIPRFMNC